jgi:hypothetical protein
MGGGELTRQPLELFFAGRQPLNSISGEARFDSGQKKQEGPSVNNIYEFRNILPLLIKTNMLNGLDGKPN